MARTKITKRKRNEPTPSTSTNPESMAEKRGAETGTDSSSSSDDEYRTIPSSQNPHSSRHYKPVVKKPKLQEPSTGDDASVITTEAEKDPEDSQSSHTSKQDVLSSDEESVTSEDDQRVLKQISKVKR